MRTAELWRFDLRWGLPTAARVMVRRLGPATTARTVASYVASSLGADPLRGIQPGTWASDRDRLSRHQFRQVLLLERALERAGLSDDRRFEVLGEVVAATGARFLRQMVATPDRATWLRMAPAERDVWIRRVVDRFFNAEVSDVSSTDMSAAFDVDACRFVELAGAVGRPELAALFCAADAARFDEPDVEIRLERTGTIATGSAKCDFRFRLDD